MKSRRAIASFFFVVYIWAAIGALCSSLTCSCAAMHRREALCARHAHDASCLRHSQDALCASCEARNLVRAESPANPQAHPQTEPQAAAAAYSGPCCNHLHALYETLYTRCCDGERCRQHLSYKLLSEKLFAAALVDPAVRQPEASDPAPVHRDRTIPPLRRGCPRLAGLRAPPVTA